MVHNEALVQLIQLVNQSKRIVFLGGAGVSTESGIPDFRSEQGIYQIVANYGTSPEKILSRSYFLSKPGAFYDFYRKHMIYSQAQPNLAHKALARMEAIGKLQAVITQNIDGLHQLAGSANVLELHGSIYRNSCMACGQRYELNHILAAEGIPICDQCGHVVKPEVVLYEEGLDDEVWSASVSAVSSADLLIIGGTSLNVYPAANLMTYFKGQAVVLINRGETPYDKQVDLLIQESIGLVLDAVVKQMG